MTNVMSEVNQTSSQDGLAVPFSVAESDNNTRDHGGTSYLMDTLSLDTLSLLPPSPGNDTDATPPTRSTILEPSYARVECSDNDREPIKHESRPQRISSYSRLESDWWIREVATLFTSYAFLIGMVVILFRYDNQPLYLWPLSISPNTYLAVSTTLAKAGLVYPVYNCIGQLKWIWFSKRDSPLDDFVTFDEASRGSWGAAGLIWRLKGRHIASVGAFVSILAMGASPITQQIITYENKLVASSTQAGLVAQAHSSDYYEGSIGQNTSYTQRDSVSLPMQQAINFALLGSGTDQILEVTPICATGNCTWPDYDSLAICYSITNVTDLLSMSDRFGDGNHSSYMPDQTEVEEFARNITLPNLASLKYGGMDGFVTSIVTPQNMLLDNSTVGPVAHHYNIIYETSAKETGPGIDQFYEPSFGALEVVFYWCIKTYHTRTIGGVASTNVTGEVRDFSIPPGSENSLEFPATYWYEYKRYNFTLSRLVSLSGNPNGTPDCTIAWNSNLAMSQLLRKKYTGTYDKISNFENNDAANAIQPLLEAETPELVLEGISNYTRNMATSMTNIIRAYVGNSTVPLTNPVNGTAYVMEIFIVVHWRWISLLAGLIGLSTIFLVATIIKTKMSKVDAMRSSSLAALTILGPEAKAYMGSTTLQGGSVERSEKLQVRLRRGSVGWSLERVD